MRHQAPADQVFLTAFLDCSAGPHFAGCLDLISADLDTLGEVIAEGFIWNELCDIIAQRGIMLVPEPAHACSSF